MIYSAFRLLYLSEGEHNGTGSSSYIRWGETECPDTAELVYSGNNLIHDRYNTVVWAHVIGLITK